MVDDTPGAINALTRKGTAFVTICSSLSFHALRLILRDAFFRSAATSPNAMMKRKVAEHYLLSAIHAFSCSAFCLRKFLSKRWTSAVGSEAMLCFSLGYTSYTLLALRGQLFSDPLFAVNEMANFVKYWSCLRAQGTGWIVPLLFSAEIPTACLDMLRMLAEVGLPPSSLAWRFCLGAFTTSFILVKGLLLPIFLGTVIARPRRFPELHQPAFLPAKLAMLLRLAMSYTWLSIVARHWVPTRHMHPEGYLVSPSAQRLPSLRNITPSLSDVWQHFRTAYNPLSLLFFSVLQACYFVGPAALPAILYALARKPGYRLAAGSALAGLGVLAVWPMHTERPYRTGGSAFPERVERWLYDRLLRYFSFKVDTSAVFEASVAKGLAEQQEPLDAADLLNVADLLHHFFTCYSKVPPSSKGPRLEGHTYFGFGEVHWGARSFPRFIVAGALMKSDVPSLSQDDAGAYVQATAKALREEIDASLAGQLVRFGGLIPATPQSIKRALTWPYPNNITFIVPGGIAEIFLMRPDLEQVFIKSRKGFIRLALQAGVDVVPVYGLGHTQLFTMLDKSSGLGGFMMRMSRRLKVSLPLSYGRLGMPLIPYSKPVAALVGKPIRIDTPEPNPSNERVDELHA
ncbi:mogat2-a, partial [Symbiodinium pilosum]